jgi:UrcA family protein
LLLTQLNSGLQLVRKPTQSTRMSVRRSLNMTRQIPSWYRLLPLLTFFLSAAAGLPAFAGGYSVNDEPSTRVKFVDLDLNTDSGRRALLDRLSKAADHVCGEQASSFASVGSSQMYLACYRRTLAAAVDKVHHAQLSALFAALSRPNTR